ncbi:hypothetical protein BS78_09G228300 [Paspalum vaginatum]|nr:hypothetical protein BS78_09G228300 [Paspalum vaginatum]
MTAARPPRGSFLTISHEVPWSLATHFIFYLFLTVSPVLSVNKSCHNASLCAPQPAPQHAAAAAASLTCRGRPLASTEASLPRRAPPAPIVALYLCTRLSLSAELLLQIQMTPPDTRDADPRVVGRLLLVGLVGLAWIATN